MNIISFPLTKQQDSFIRWLTDSESEAYQAGLSCGINALSARDKTDEDVSASQCSHEVLHALQCEDSSENWMFLCGLLSHLMTPRNDCEEVA